MPRAVDLEKVATQCDPRRQSQLFRDLDLKRLQQSGLVRTTSRSAPATLITQKLFDNLDHLPIYVHRYS